MAMIWSIGIVLFVACSVYAQRRTVLELPTSGQPPPPQSRPVYKYRPPPPQPFKYRPPPPPPPPPRQVPRYNPPPPPPPPPQRPVPRYNPPPPPFFLPVLPPWFFQPPPKPTHKAPAPITTRPTTTRRPTTTTTTTTPKPPEIEIEYDVKYVPIPKTTTKRPPPVTTAGLWWFFGSAPTTPQPVFAPVKDHSCNCYKGYDFCPFNTYRNGDCYKEQDAIRCCGSDM